MSLVAAWPRVVFVWFSVGRGAHRPFFWSGDVVWLGGDGLRGVVLMVCSSWSVAFRGGGRRLCVGFAVLVVVAAVSPALGRSSFEHACGGGVRWVDPFREVRPIYLLDIETVLPFDEACGCYRGGVVAEAFGGEYECEVHVGDWFEVWSLRSDGERASLQERGEFSDVEFGAYAIERVSAGELDWLRAAGVLLGCCVLGGLCWFFSGRVGLVLPGVFALSLAVPCSALPSFSWDGCGGAPPAGPSSCGVWCDDADVEFSGLLDWRGYIGENGAWQGSTLLVRYRVYWSPSAMGVRAPVPDHVWYWTLDTRSSPMAPWVLSGYGEFYYDPPGLVAGEPGDFFPWEGQVVTIVECALYHGIGVLLGVVGLGWFIRVCVGWWR